MVKQVFDNIRTRLNNCKFTHREFDIADVRLFTVTNGRIVKREALYDSRDRLNEERCQLLVASGCHAGSSTLSR